MATQFAKTYNSFSGVDIKAVFANVVMGELQAISYSITREKAPLYTMGSPDPRSFSRGKRGIAGTLIFLMFDRHALLGAFGNLAGVGSPSTMYFLADADELMPNTAVDQSQIGSTVPITTLAAGSAGVNLQAFNASPQTMTRIDDDKLVAAPWFADQIPPFDVTLAAANEYGALAVMRIYGLEILNEGYGVSIDDIVSEQQMTYVARTLQPWTPVQLDPNKAAQLNGDLSSNS